MPCSSMIFGKKLKMPSKVRLKLRLECHHSDIAKGSQCGQKNEKDEEEVNLRESGAQECVTVAYQISNQMLEKETIILYLLIYMKRIGEVILSQITVIMKQHLFITN